MANRGGGSPFRRFRGRIPATGPGGAGPVASGAVAPRRGIGGGSSRAGFGSSFRAWFRASFRAWFRAGARIVFGIASGIAFATGGYRGVYRALPPGVSWAVLRGRYWRVRQAAQASGVSRSVSARSPARARWRTRPARSSAATISRAPVSPFSRVS